MKIELSNKAKCIKNTFTVREMAVYTYIMQLMEQDEKDFAEIEIAKRAGDSIDKTQEGFKKVYALNTRAGYILQCMGLYTSLENGVLTITTL